MKIMDEKTQKQMDEWVEWTELRNKTQRKNFDYQERWHGWRSPVGLNLGFALFGLGVLFISMAVAAIMNAN